MTRRALNLARWPCRVHSDVTVRPAGVTGGSGRRIGTGPQVTPPARQLCSPAGGTVQKGAGPGFLRITSSAVSTRFQPVPPKSSVTVYSCEIVRRNNSGRDPSLEPLKRQVGLRRNADSPKHIQGRPRLGAFRRVCDPCDSADTSRPAGFGDHRGRAAYLTAVRIKVYSIPKGHFPMSEACSWESRLFSFKQTYHCFVLGATGGFITQIKGGVWP